MLSASHRIRRSEDFRRVLRAGLKSRSDVGLIAVIHRDGGSSRLGVVVNRKVGGAVVRNTVKRRIRHSFAELLTELPSVDVVVRCAETAAGLGVREIKQLLREACRRRESLR